MNYTVQQDNLNVLSPYCECTLNGLEMNLRCFVVEPAPRLDMVIFRYISLCEIKVLLSKYYAHAQYQLNNFCRFCLMGLQISIQTKMYATFYICNISKTIYWFLLVCFYSLFCHFYWHYFYLKRYITQKIIIV